MRNARIAGAGSVAAALLLMAGFALALAASPRDSAAVTPMPPNLRSLPASQLSISNSGGDRLLRLSATTWNDGAGPLELRGAELDNNGKQKVYQRIKHSDGSYVETLAGSFTYHVGHGHTHFDDYATYSLQSVANPGNPQRFSAKTTFCIIDTYVADLSLAGAPPSPQYTSCSTTIQGMSVGWGDLYPYYLEGQAIDIDGLPDGDYYLHVIADPQGRLIESDDKDNTTTIVINISGNSVSINDSDGDGCDDAQELGLDEGSGGQRSPLDPWDFYDVDANAAIDLSDTLDILGAFGLSTGDAGYNALYDRIAGPPEAPWRTSAATGVSAGIDLQDALANLRSFGHDCS